MKKMLAPLFVLLIVGAVISFAIMPSTPAATKKLSNDIENMLKSGKTVFIQLSSSGCVTCRKMKPEVEKAMAEFSNSSIFQIINIDVDSHPSLASRFAVTAVPTQVVLSSGNKEIYRNIGYMSFDNIKSVLESTNNSM